MALRRQVGSLGFTVSGETGDVWTESRTSATGSPYRWTSVSVDRSRPRLADSQVRPMLRSTARLVQR